MSNDAITLSQFNKFKPIREGIIPINQSENDENLISQ